MNYNKLRYFYEVAKVQNLSRTAELLYISQPSLSKAISDLEKEFHTPLFIRTNRNLILTPAGIVLQKKLEPVFSHEQEILDAVQATSTAQQLSGHLQIDYMAFDQALNIHSYIKSFQQNYPAIEIHAMRKNKKAILKKMEDHTTDITFLIHTMDDNFFDYDYKILNEHHLSLIVPNDHPLAQRQQVSISEINNEPIIAHGHKKNSDEYNFSFGWAIRNGLQPNITAEYDYVETVLMQVSFGAGIALLSDAAPISAFSNLVNVPLKNAPILYTSVCWNPQNDFSATELFLQNSIMKSI